MFGSKLLRFIAINLLTAVVAKMAAAAVSQTPLAGKTIKIDYVEGQSYSITFNEENLTWTGLQGEDLGKSETDAYQSMMLGEKTYFVSWVESDGSSIALVLNLKTKKAFAIGHEKGSSWQREGQISL